MLQVDKSRPAVGTVIEDSVSSAQLLTQFVGFIRRQLALIIFIPLLTTALGLAHLATTPARYTGWASMIIDTGKLQMFRQQSVLADVPVDSSAIESQVEVLKSENIALAVVKELRLAEDPEFTGPGGGLIGTLLGSIPRFFAPATPQSEAALTQQALGALQSRTMVKRVGLTYVINIGAEARDPERAAEIANAIAEAYIVDQLEAKYQTTRRAAMWLQERLKELRTQASVAERTVVDFKTKNNIVDTGGRLMNEQQLTELSSALVQARANTAEAKARLDRVNQILREDNPDPANKNAATVADSLRNDVVTKLRQQYLEIATREAEWSRRYGHTHLAAVNLRNQMADIRHSVGDELRRIAETYKSDYEIAKSRQDSVEQSLSSIVSQSQVTNQAQIQLRELESTSQTFRALYDNFLQRYMESVQQQSFPITEARVITKASPPTRKSSPKTLIVLAIAVSGGMLVGFGAGVLRELSDRVFRASGQVESTLQTNCLAVLPKVKAGAKREAPKDKSATDHINARTILRDHGVLWYAMDSSFSRFAESIRAIKVAADLARVSRPNTNKVIAVTSALPNEGKSTVAAAFAQVIAQGGARVILVDGDLRNPSLSRYVAPNARAGLIEVISGKVRLEEALWTEPEINLKFLPAVLHTRLSNSGEILASPATKQLFDQLRSSYDHIIVDLPPLAPVVDVRATTELIDSYVFVIEWGRTKIDVVEHTLRAAPEVYDGLLGVVLNKADLNRLGRYDGLQGNYYYNRYYSRYGYTD